MTKTIPTKKNRKSSKEVASPMSPELLRSIETANARIANVAGKVARKNDKIQREARQAIADTLDDWIAWMADEDPPRVEEFLFEIGCIASASNRRRLLKHAQMPEGVSERVEEQVEAMKEAEEQERAEAKTTSAAGDDKTAKTTEA